MGRNFKPGLAAALCAAITLTSPPTDAIAGPMTAASKASVELTAPIDDVHYRRYYHRHRRPYYRYGYDPGGAVFAAAALGIMGAGIAAASRPYYGWGWGYPGPYGGWGWGYPGPYGGWGWGGWGW
jgi:hypothetical protein